MKFVQYYLDCLSQASYLIGDDTTGRAVVVDPRRVVGALDRPALAFAQRPDVVEVSSRVTALQLADALVKVPDLVVLDVRGPGERAAGSIEGSVHIPIVQLRGRTGELDANHPVVVYCAGGYRSSIGASLLRTRGFADVSDLIGGYQAWAAAT